MNKSDNKRSPKVWHKVAISVAKGGGEKKGADAGETGLSPIDAFVGAVQALPLTGIESKGEGSEQESVEAYFDNAIDPADLQKHMELIAELISAAGGRKLQIGTIKEVKEEDWAEEWRRSWKPMRVTNGIMICPSWMKPTKKRGKGETGIGTLGRKGEEGKRRKGGGSDTSERPEQTVIYIYPRMAFGTGSHATTQICLRLLELYLRPGARAGTRVIDIGAGSAILSIGAAKLGARSVLAVEMDEIAVENAIENCKFNRVLSKVKIVCDRLGPSIKGRFDLGICNMLGHDLLPLLPDTTQLLAGKALIVSGLTKESAVAVRAEMAQLGWHIKKTLRRGEWVGFYATHGKTKFRV